IFFSDSISSPFLAVAIFSIFLILIRTRRSGRELAAVAVIVAIFAGFDLRLLGYPFSGPVLLSFVGLASLAALTFRVIWSEGAEKHLALITLVPAFLFVASEWGASYFLEWGERVRPKVLDLYLFSFDSSLHVQFPFLMGQAFARVPWFAFLSLLAYLGLPVAIG